jgi:methionine S-methyltransferase
MDPSSTTAAPVSAEALLAACARSSAEAYEAFRGLLARLDDPAERTGARRLLEDVTRELAAAGGPAEQAARFHVSLERLPTGACEEPSDLDLLQLPGVFAPEDWSLTFFEGLARYPASELEGLTVAELGCGSGWITLALARRSRPHRVYGLDVNPRAIVCARLNLYLNGLDAEGLPVPEGDGRSLLDRVELAVSDLLAHCRERDATLDRVIGCIPQVLRPDLETTVEAVSETASDEFLHSLSNYTGKQGYVEDQFGLGLIARALEESVERLRPNGRVIFNLGGRPGKAVLRRMFERRGLAVREVWTTTIPQAGDTDILPLVEIEAGTPHRFEFFLGRHDDEPVSATTAWAYARAGGSISHSLTVFEGRLRFPATTRRIFRSISAAGFREARSALDLSFEDEARAEEKTAFLAHLAESLATAEGGDGGRRAFPYGPTAGSLPLRRHLAEFMRRYFGVPLGPESLLVLPSREAAVRNLVDLYRPRLALVDRELARGLPRGAPTADDGPAVLEGARRADLTRRLMEALGPELVVTRLAGVDARTPDAFDRLVETAGRHGSRLVLDVSDLLELSSTPEVPGLFRELAETPLSPHVALLCGLVKNRVYRDLEVAFLVSENRDLLAALADAAELTYSRPPALAEEYYDAIVEELLSFRVARRGAEEPVRPPRGEDDAGVELPPVAERCRRAFAHPAVATLALPIGEATVRFDYGESSLPAPDLVRESLLESFARKTLAPAEADPAPEVAAFLQRRMGIDSGAAGSTHLGLGVADLFAALVRGTENGGGAGTFLFPSGAYGYFVAAVELFGGRVVTVPTRRADRFALRPEALEAALAGLEGDGDGPDRRPWVFLNAPVSNPSGAVYGSRELAALLAVAARRGARVVLDAVFAGLEHRPPPPERRPQPLLDPAGPDLLVLGGISKELAGAGLRFGFGWTQSPEVAATLARGGPTAPHATIRFAARRMLARLVADGASAGGDGAAAQLARQRRELRERAGRLTRVLEEHGWDVLPPEGGLFLVARPAAYEGRDLGYQTLAGERRVTLDADSVAEALFWTEDVLINDSVWTGIPGWCRFAFAVPEGRFEEGLVRLSRFAARCGVTGG